MDERTQKRFSFIVNIFYIAIFIALFYMFVRWALPLVAPFIVAMVLASLLQRPSNYLNRKTKIPKGLVGTILVLLLTGVVIALIALLGVRLTGRVKDFISFLTSKFDSLPALITLIQNKLLDLAARLPEAVAAPLTDSIRDFSADSLFSELSDGLSSGNLIDALRSPISGAWSAVKQLPSIVIGIVITIVSTCFLTADYNTIRDFIYLQFPESRRKKLGRAKNLVVYSIGKIVKSYILIILCTTVELSVGLTILRLLNIYDSGYIIPISLLIALIDIVPVLGTGTVLIPWAIISFLTGNVGMGIGLIIIYAVIAVIRQIIEPKLVAGQFDLPAIVTIASMFIGTKLFGAIGLFLLPLTVIVFKLLVDEGIITLLKTSRSEARAEAIRAGADEAELDAGQNAPATEKDKSSVTAKLSAFFKGKKKKEQEKKNQNESNDN